MEKNTEELNKEIENLKKRLEEVEESYTDLQVMHDNVVEHSTSIENELESNNKLINQIMEKMKRFLSPQLYQIITGTDSNMALTYRRKKLTIFFSDLVGFSAITDSVEPEVLSQCLNHYLDEMSKIALKYNGTVDKFIGDAILVFFGDPVFESDEIHAKKCVRMALDMQEAMTDVNDYWHKAGISQELKVRVGVNTGYATVGNFGTEERMDYTIIGGQVNLASRLQSIAEPGTIVISQSTKVLVDDDIETKCLGTVTVKGIHTPLEVHRALGKKGSDVKSDSYLIRQDCGFVFPQFSYMTGQTNPEDRNRILKSLKEAIREIEKNA